LLVDQRQPSDRLEATQIDIIDQYIKLIHRQVAGIGPQSRQLTLEPIQPLGWLPAPGLELGLRNRPGNQPVEPQADLHVRSTDGQPHPLEVLTHPHTNHHLHRHRHKGRAHNTTLDKASQPRRGDNQGPGAGRSPTDAPAGSMPMPVSVHSVLGLTRHRCRPSVTCAVPGSTPPISRADGR
jgi:hypothetical protein